MPARHENNRRSQVRKWLQEHEGDHRPVEIAHDMGIATHGAATDCIALFKQGLVVKSLTPVSGRAKPITTYRYRPDPVKAEPTPEEVTA